MAAAKVAGLAARSSGKVLDLAARSSEKVLDLAVRSSEEVLDLAARSSEEVLDFADRSSEGGSDLAVGSSEEVAVLAVRSAEQKLESVVAEPRRTILRAVLEVGVYCKTAEKLAVEYMEVPTAVAAVLERHLLEKRYFVTDRHHSVVVVLVSSTAHHFVQWYSPWSQYDRDLRAQSFRRSRDARAKGPNAHHPALVSVLCDGHSHEAHQRHHLEYVSELEQLAVVGGLAMMRYGVLVGFGERQHWLQTVRDGHAGMADPGHFELSFLAEIVELGFLAEIGLGCWYVREVAQKDDAAAVAALVAFVAVHADENFVDYALYGEELAPVFARLIESYADRAVFAAEFGHFHCLVVNWAVRAMGGSDAVGVPAVALGVHIAALSGQDLVLRPENDCPAAAAHDAVVVLAWLQDDYFAGIAAAAAAAAARDEQSLIHAVAEY